MYSRYSKRSPSPSSETSNQPSSIHRNKSPATSDYEYLGRLVTRERPIARTPKPVQQNLLFPPNKQKHYHSMRSDRQEMYREETGFSTEEDNDNPDGLNKPLGVIRISDRHYREIYRLPTPPPKIKRVFHRLRSPEPKIIERVFVRRPPPQIIENVIEVPAEKVRIINREKYLEKSTPITRSKLVHLKSDRQRREEEQHQYQETHLPSEQQSYIPMDQEGTTIQQSPQTATTLVYPPQQNMRTVGYIKSTVPPEVMFNSQQPLQIPTSQIFNQQAMQPSPYDNPPQQTIQPTPYNNPPQQTINQQIVQPTPQYQPNTPYQMVQPTTFNYPSQQPVSYQMAQPTSFPYPAHQFTNHQMVPPTPFNFPSQPAMPFSPYGYPQY